eukprot:SAG11_NODE_180_length_13278_cov_9.158434_5_plen_53_part_00
MCALVHWFLSFNDFKIFASAIRCLATQVATFPIQKGQAMMQGTGNYPNIFVR